MSRMVNRYVIIGAGAIGGGIGGLLAAQGTPVVLAARGEHLERMREHGLRLLMPDADLTVPVMAIAGPEEIELTPDDVLVLATKTHQAESALADWADAPVGDGTAGSELPLLTALNGVSAELRALRWFRRVYGVCVWMPAVMLNPGEVILRCVSPRGLLHTGRVPAELTTEQDRALLAEIAADWGRAELEVPLPEDVMPWKYRKLLGNLGNAVQALLGSSDAAIVSAVRAEAEQIYAATGIALNSEADEQRFRSTLQTRPVPGAPETLGGSTWQSIARGSGTTEVDFLNGEIAAMAYRMGRTAPINSALARLTRQAGRDGLSPGAITAEELTAALGVERA